MRGGGRMKLSAAMLAVALLCGAAPTKAQTRPYALVRSGDEVRDKNFYLLTLLDGSASARAAIIVDPALRSLRDRSVAAVHEAMACATTACVTSAIVFTEEDIARVGDTLARLADNQLKPLIRDHIRASGRFQRHAALDDAGLIRAAWEDTARGVNRLYRVYALGEAPRYPEINSMMYKADDKRLLGSIKEALETADDGVRDDAPFFEPWAQIGLDLLLISQRDEAARYEPLEKLENGPAVRRAAKLDWRKFPYTAIVVPGAGGRDEERGLSASGAMRVRLAVRRYRQGLAPFLIVSGGHVHPNKTPYSEAVEMKRELMTRHGLPADAIFIDPHARHTTTNLRNASRILYRAGAPMDRDVLIVTSKGQSSYIESKVFATRNQTELGYQPMTVGRRVSPFDLAMRPEIASLYADPTDPLDP